MQLIEVFGSEKCQFIMVLPIWICDEKGKSKSAITFRSHTWASFIYKQRPIGRCGPRVPKQQRPRGVQLSCDLDADQL